ncbi:MAG TPA: TolC family protein [Gemmatimonadaceae bacterium]|jgi:outer membrane protein|nr:TolC family protein [Gemmatimonadaceae bacterium]
MTFLRRCAVIPAALAWVHFFAPALHAQQPSDTVGVPHTLTLGQAARLAAQNSAHALEAMARARQAHARSGQSRAQFLPNIDALLTPASARTYNIAPQLGINFSIPGQKAFFDPNGQVIGPVNDITYGARASDTLFSLGAISRFRATKAAEAASYADASQQADSAASAAANAYLQTQHATALLSARIADSVLATDLLQIAKDQLAAGVGISLDVTRAQSQLATVRAQLIQTRNDVDRARLDFLRTLGLPLDTPVELSDSLTALPFVDALPPEEQSIDRAFQQRPDLKAADLQLQSSAREIGAIRDERLPALSAYGTWAEDGIAYKYLLPVYSVGLQVSFPIFDGLRREGRIEEQKAAAHEIEVRRRDLRQRIAIEVRQAYLDLASERQQVDAARERSRLSADEVDQANQRFRSGVAGNTDVILAEQDVDAARTAVVDALNGYQIARVALARALGAVQQLP